MTKTTTSHALSPDSLLRSLTVRLQTARTPAASVLQTARRAILDFEHDPRYTVEVIQLRGIFERRLSENAERDPQVGDIWRSYAKTMSQAAGALTLDEAIAIARKQSPERDAWYTAIERVPMPADVRPGDYDRIEAERQRVIREVLAKRRAES